MHKFKQTTSLLAISVAAAAFTAPTMAQESADAAPIEEVVVIGSRSQKPRTATDSPVPVDSFSNAEFNSVGNAVDITDNLKALVPSYTAAPATGDGSAFVRATSLRGLSPDQTLVLVNGKRRHRSALVQFLVSAAGAGAHSPDVGMIPSIALKRVEVLRDGAAAQYGSDAIAGVMNFVMKDASEGGEVSAQYGNFYEGEQSLKFAANAGFGLGESGFFNISAEWFSNDALSRGIQRPVAQDLIDAGVEGIGEDSPFGDAPFVQTWGRPETEGGRVFINAGIDISENSELYVHGGYGDTTGRYRFFYRAPNHSTLVALSALGFNDLPQGYTPFLDGLQSDFNVVSGVKGETDGGFFYDISGSFGENKLDYFLNNTINPDAPFVGGAPQRDFYNGGYEQREVNLNADFSKAMTENVNVAFGSEWREETYTAVEGESGSYVGAGSSGLKGVTPENAGSFSRSNYAFYVDIEHDISDEFMLQYAARYENFSDFGGTFNGKLAGRYRISDNLTLRGAISTGFHAPTPGQANVRTTITTFDGATGLQVEEGLVVASNPLAILAGAAPLKEETSVNYSFGFTSSIGEATTLTVDAYRIEVDDRIYRTGDIQPQGADGPTISFFTNAIDIVSQGVDVVLTSSMDWGTDATTDFSFAGSYNKLEVVNQHVVGGVIPVSDSRVEDIENNYPNLRFNASANTHFNEKFDFLVRANFYGSHFDERGTIQANPETGGSAKIDATIYFDMELGYQHSESLRFTLGAANIFDSYVGEIGAPNDNRLSVGLPYPRRSAANYEGGSWYLRANFTF